jgi:glycosyltransferase involved in cell wall biosynthesis
MLRVVQIGPGLDVRGGISEVIRLIAQNPPPGGVIENFSTLSGRAAAAHFPKWNPNYYIRSFYSVLEIVKKTKDIRSTIEDCDLAHIHITVAGSTLRKYLISRQIVRKNIPFILHLHTSEYHIFYSRLPPPVQRRIQRLFLNSQGVIILSHGVLKDYRQTILGDLLPVWILPNPVALPQEFGAKHSSHLRLLFLGRLGSHKGSDRVLRALSGLPMNVRERVTVCMAGDGKVDATRKLAHELGLAAQVEVRDWIGGEEKLCWFRDTNGFILPSRLEGLPMGMLEAMAWGKALIVSPVGGIPEFVTDGVEGFLVPPDDIDAIADAIRKLAENPELRAQMGMAARRRVEPLDIQNYRIRLGEIYREALG